jgi:hypothetical protein
MKRIYIAAGALLLGTSAFAWAPSSVPVAHSDKVPVAAVDPGKAPEAKLVAKSNALPKIAYDTAKPENASASWLADDSSLTKSAKPDSLAKWDATGGDMTGMGGPYEPVDSVQANGDGTIDAALGETAADERLASADSTWTATPAAAGSEYTGMGGPLEAVDYPPCRPGPGDDRCIQLYERGVTGR